MPVFTILLHVAPVAHHYEWSREVNGVIGATLQKHFFCLRVVFLRISHTACSPIKELVNNLTERQYTLGLIQLFCPF